MRPPAVAVAASLVALLVVDVAVVLLHDEAVPYRPEQALTDFRAQALRGPSPSPSPSRSSATDSVASTAPAGPSAAPAAAPTARTRTAAPTATAAAAPAEVEEGVYRYATSGHEEVDVLGGSRHDYPAETAVTFRRSGCGVEDRWQPLEGRFSANDVCRGSRGLEVRESVQRRTFFSQSEEQDLVCTAPVVLVPDDARAGQTSTGTCRSDDTEVRLTARVVDVRDMTVGGRQVQAVHVSVDGTLTGATRGTTHREEWFDRGGLLLRAAATTDTDRDTDAGVVHYDEAFELRLLSLDPQR
ncbi:MAG: hypothetical protein ABR614_11465 [Mycobacteriales bacterium]